MAISKNLLMTGVSGALDKQVVFRQLHGKTIVCAYPDMSERKLSPKQVEMNMQMKSANRYAKEIMANDQQRNEAQLRLDVPRNKLYIALIREYLKNTPSTNEDVVSADEGLAPANEDLSLTKQDVFPTKEDASNTQKER